MRLTPGWLKSIFIGQSNQFRPRREIEKAQKYYVSRNFCHVAIFLFLNLPVVCADAGRLELSTESAGRGGEVGQKRVRGGEICKSGRRPVRDTSQ